MEIEKLNLAVPLIEDAIEAYDKLSVKPSEFELRNIVRCFSAGIEGLVQQTVYIIKMQKGSLNELTPHEIAALDEESYFVDESGNVKPQSKYIKLTTKVKLLVNLLRRIHADFDMDFEGESWESFTKFGSIRNGLMHPKSTKDLEITTSDLDHCHRAFWWSMLLAIKANSAHTNTYKRIYAEHAKDQIESDA